MNLLLKSGLMILCMSAVTSECWAQKLPYPARQAVKRQTSNVAKLGRNLAYLNDGTLKSGAIRANQVKGMINRLDDSSKLCDSVERDLSKSPKDHPKVKALLDQVTAHRATIASGKQQLQALLTNTNKAESASTYGDVNADLERLKHIIDTHNISNLTDNPETSAGVIRNAPQMAQWFQERAKAYEPLFKNGSAEGRKLHTQMKWAARLLKQLAGNITQFDQQADAALAQNLKDAERWISRAQKDNNPHLLEGALKRPHEQIEGLLLVWSAIRGDGDAAVKAGQAKLDNQKQKVAELRVSMREKIIANTRLPHDAYRGADKAEIERRILAQWAKAYPKDEILEIRFHRQDWKRNKKLRWSEAEQSWDLSDWSYLAALVVVKTDNKIATLYPAYINRNNLDSSTNIGVKTKGGEHVVRQMLLTNLK